MARVSLSKYYRSFSGTDTIAFLVFPGCTPIAIGTLTTISYSMYRSKVPVLNIGRTNINITKLCPLLFIIRYNPFYFN